MGRIGKTAAAALLVLALSACTGGTPDPAASPGSTAAPPATGGTQSDPPGQAGGGTVSLETGSDVGNGRPASSHDGLMVRRRIVIAVHPAAESDPDALRRRLDEAAAQQGLELSDISPMVLDELVLEHIVPEVIVALPADLTREDADRLAELAFGHEGSYAGVEHVHVGQVLVHDLQFRIGAEDPASLAATIASEGILSDALGNYAASLDGGALTVGYTGPLLSDALVESVREGMARGAGREPGAVELAPRSASGDGVVLSLEPAPDQAASADDSGHHGPGDDDSGTGDSDH